MEYTLYLTFNLLTMCCNIFVWIILSDLYHHCFYFTLLCKFCAQVTHSSEIAFLNMHQVCPTHSPYDQTKKGKVPFELKKKNYCMLLNGITQLLLSIRMKYFATDLYIIL